MGTIESHIEVINNTNQDIVTTSVYSCDNYDWKGDSRPDKNFQGHVIPAQGGSVSQRATLNKQASYCPFNMILTFSDGTIDEFRIHQKHVIGCCAGFNHMKQAHTITYYVVSDNKPKLVIKIDNTNKQTQNGTAEEKNQEGEAALEAQEYENAIKKFNEALELANEDSTIDHINNNKSRAYNEFGKLRWQNAWDLEADITTDRYQEVQDTLKQALNLFQEALTLLDSSEYQQNLMLVSLKIEGNRILAEANQLESEGFELFGESDKSAALSKYKEALLTFQKALIKYEEGAQLDQEKFDDSVSIARGHIDEVNKMIDDINGNDLSDVTSEEELDEEEKKTNDYGDRIDPSLIQRVSVPSVEA